MADNLLDKASILLTPTAYNDGSMLSVKPENGDGDFQFSRSSAATRVNAQGLVENVQIISSELVSNGDFSNGLTNWSVNGGSYAAIVSGALNSNNPDAGNWYAENISQNISFVNGKTYKITFKAKNISGNLNLRITQGANPMASLDLTSTFVDYTYFYTANADNGSIRIFCNSAVGQFQIENISVKEITEDTDLPRIDYTDGCGVWLLEPQSTNLVNNSELLNIYFSSKTDTTITDNYGTSPSGETNSSRIQFADDTSFCYSVISVSTDHTSSVFVKGISGETVRFGIGSSVVTGDLFTFNGLWQRIDFTTSSATQIFFSSYYGATTRDFEAFGLQLEALPYATSYIPTNGATNTRLQDIATNSGNSTLINSTEGVLYAEIAALANDGTNRMIALSNIDSSNHVRIYYANSTNKISVAVKSNNSNEYIFLNYNVTDITDYIKIAVKYKANDFATFINGVKVNSQTTTASAPIGLDRLNFDRGDGAQKFEGKAKALAVYKEALTDAQLQSLTTT